MRSLTTLAAGTLVAAALSGPAIGQEMADPGLYIFGALGVHQPEDSDVEGDGVNTDAEFDWDWAGLAGAGYETSSNLRFELEGGYRPSDIDSIGGASGAGDIEATSLMGNVFYDFDLGSPFIPYIGGGLGVVRLDANGVNPVSGASVDDDDLGAAFQLGAGAAYALNERLKLTLDYRYLSALGTDFTDSAGRNLDADYDDHAIFVGLRFQLNPPAAPMAAAAAPPPPPAQPERFQPAQQEPVREFLVFFDWDRADITPEAREILQAAAAEAGRVGTVRIVATGHADRSGPAAYNEGLSQRRADNVRAELERLGIQGGEIATFARGESEPLVATDDGVREPRNRRVQLVLE